MNISPTFAATPFSERRMQVALRVAPRIAIDAVDTYVAGLTTVGMPMVQGAQLTGSLGQSVAASAQSAGGVLPMLNGVLAAGHGIAGAYNLFADTDGSETTTSLRARKLMAIGELVTAAGFAGQAFGYGVWALPLTVLGIVTATTAHTIRANALQQ